MADAVDVDEVNQLIEVLLAAGYKWDPDSQKLVSEIKPAVVMVKDKKYPDGFYIRSGDGQIGKIGRLLGKAGGDWYDPRKAWWFDADDEDDIRAQFNIVSVEDGNKKRALEIEDINDREFVLLGDTFKLKDEIKALHDDAVFDKIRRGWKFPSEARDAVEAFVAEQEQTAPKKSISKAASTKTATVSKGVTKSAMDDSDDDKKPEKTKKKTSKNAESSPKRTSKNAMSDSDDDSTEQEKKNKKKVVKSSGSTAGKVKPSKSNSRSASAAAAASSVSSSSSSAKKKTASIGETIKGATAPAPFGKRYGNGVSNGTVAKKETKGSKTAKTVVEDSDSE